MDGVDVSVAAALLLALNSIAPAEYQTADKIEFNRVTYAGGGCFEQVILWNWDFGDFGPHVDFWCHLSNCSKIERVGDKWQVQIRRHGKIVTVRAVEFIETNTDFDREIDSRC